MATAAHALAPIVTTQNTAAPLTTEGYFATCARLAAEHVAGNPASEERIDAIADHFGVTPSTFLIDLEEAIAAETSRS